MMRARFWVVVFVGFGFLAGPALAANTKDYSDCDQTDNDDLRIAACSRLIKSGDLSTRSLSIAYNKRGAAWVGKGDYDKAMSDYNLAIKTDLKLVGARENRGLLYK